MIVMREVKVLTMESVELEEPRWLVDHQELVEQRQRLLVDLE